MAPVRTTKHGAQCGRIRLRVSAAQLGGVTTLDAKLHGIELVLVDSPVLHLADEVRTTGRQLVDAAGAVHDVRPCRIELDEGVGECPREPRRVDAEHERPRAGRVRERPEHVEDGTRRELAADGRGVPHRRMVRLREEEAEAELVDRLLDPLGRQRELESERLEHVGGAGRG